MMKFSFSKRLFLGIVFFSFLSQAAHAGFHQPNDALPVVPLRQLMPDFRDESGLENLFVFDPNEDLVDNPQEVETFLDFNFKSHPSLVIPVESGLPAPENPKKLTCSNNDIPSLSGNADNLRTVKFLEIRLSGLVELQQFLSGTSLGENLPNLKFIFLKLPANTQPDQVGNLLESNPLSDYRVFFSIDSSN